MKFLLLSGDGAGLGLALRIRDEGHDVTAHIRNRSASRDYDGILPKVDSFAEALTKDTIVVFDSVGGGKTADRLRGQGYAVVGGSMFADQLAEKEMGEGLMEEVGLPIGKSAAGSVEIGTVGWFDGTAFATPMVHALHRERVMNGDLGAEGYAGCAVWPCQQQMLCPVTASLMRMAPLLRHHGFVGPIELCSSVTENGVVAREFEPGMPYAMPAILETMTEGVGDVLAKLARGERLLQFPMHPQGFGAGVLVSIPPYPYAEAAAPQGVLVGGLVRADRPHAYFHNVILDDEPVLRTSGAWGAVATFTGFGEGIREAIQRPMEIAHRVELVDKQHRTDLDAVFDHDFYRYREFTTPKDRTEPQPILTASPGSY